MTAIGERATPSGDESACRINLAAGVLRENQ